MGVGNRFAYGNVSEGLARKLLGAAGLIPASRIAPGAQLTVLRSAPAIAPTASVWADSGYVDFVADCGADPTGVLDCAPAFDRAFALISALAVVSPGTKSAVRLFIPTGLYGLKSAPAAWALANLTTNVEIVGAGRDATIIQLYGFDPPSIGGAQNARLADLTCEGTTAGNDCVQGWTFGSIGQIACVERVRFFNVRAQFAACYFLYCTNIHANEVAVVSCSSQTNDWGVVTAQGFANLHYSNGVSYDVGFLNGLGNGTQFVGNTTWLMILGDHLKGEDHLISITDCKFDEHAQAQIRVLGEAAFPIQSLIVRNVGINPAVNDGVPANMIAGLDVRYVSVVDINGFANNSFSPSGTSVAPTIKLADVDAAYLRGVKVGTTPPSNSNYITAAATVNYLEISESPSLTPASIQSAAVITRVHTLGVWSRLGPAAGAITAGWACKIASVGGVPGFDKCAIIDVPGQCVGFAINSTSAPADNLLVSEPGQSVQAVNDGFAGLAIGDKVTISPNAAGRVSIVGPGAGLVGISKSAVAAVADAPVVIWFQPGSAI